MNKLLCSGFSRLKKNRFFWAECVFMIAYGIFLVVNKYMQQVTYHTVESLDKGFFGYTMAIGVAMALFESLFVGTEYSDGTIRNKLIVGHSRIKIYLANLSVNIAAALLLCLCFLIPVTAIGIPLLGVWQAGADIILWMLLGTLLLAAAFSAVFTMFSMICSSKTAVLTASIIFMIALFLVAVVVEVKLDAPEYVTSYFMNQEGGIETRTEPNPKYLTESEREFYQFVYDFLPTGQAMQYSLMSAMHLWQMPLYSVLISLAVTGAGTAIFRRKDIK